ncbi:hypothetical protein CDD83_4864 [Cordyceps sp. RAO-2017]|nr:hypothetical protein CDD83_4864 [Cordyceps sp. RAO-2017]
MSADPTAPGPGEGILDGVSAALNGSEASAAAPATALGYLERQGFMLLELKLLAGALGIIYLGAHAALRRPPSASPAKRKRAGDKGEEEEEEPFSQGLELSDAIMTRPRSTASCAGTCPPCPSPAC